MALAENLKALRKHKSLTQKELADLSGISCSSIINYENSRRTSPPISVLQKLARALDVSVDFLTDHRVVFREDGRMELYLNVSEYVPENLLVDDWEEFIAERGEQDIIEQLTYYIKQLNKEGASEALKRVRELTELQRYRVAELPPLKPDFNTMLADMYRRQKMEAYVWQEDAPPTAAAPSPGSDQTDAGK